MPLKSVFRWARGLPSLHTILLYLCIAFSAISVALLPALPGLRIAVLRAQHLTPGSLPEWFLIQILPTMYGGSHLFYRGPADPGPGYLDPAQGRTEWVNHYPAKVIVFMDQRRPLCLSSRPQYFVFVSKYRGTSLVTRWRAVPDEGGLVVETVKGPEE